MARPTIPKEHFTDVRWQQKRLKVMERDGWKCQGTGDHEGMLNVHHRTYTTSDPWHELDENLITLCEKHHNEEHLHLGKAASEVSIALKSSNWMVTQRQQLARCIRESIITPEEICLLIEERGKERKKK